MIGAAVSQGRGIPHVLANGDVAGPGVLNENFRHLTDRLDALAVAAVLADHATVLDVEQFPGGPTARTIRLEGVNLQIVNHRDPDQTEFNGAGNLIVGYNEVLEESVHQYQDVRRGSHHIVVGVGLAHWYHGGMVTGIDHFLGHRYSSISGGRGNRAESRWDAMSGGFSNRTNETESTVCGGAFNAALDKFTAIHGGSRQHRLR